jgi:hypothetical protein
MLESALQNCTCQSSIKFSMAPQTPNCRKLDFRPQIHSVAESSGTSLPLASLDKLNSIHPHVTCDLSHMLNSFRDISLWSLSFAFASRCSWLYSLIYFCSSFAPLSSSNTTLNSCLSSFLSSCLSSCPSSCVALALGCKCGTISIPVTSDVCSRALTVVLTIYIETRRRRGVFTRIVARGIGVNERKPARGHSCHHTLQNKHDICCIDIVAGRTHKSTQKPWAVKHKPPPDIVAGRAHKSTQKPWAVKNKPPPDIVARRTHKSTQKPWAVKNKPPPDIVAGRAISRGR